MKNIYATIEQLTKRAISEHFIETRDEIYVRNQILALLKYDEFISADVDSIEKDLPTLLEELIDYACENHIIEDYLDEREILASKIMNTMLPLPSGVAQQFYSLYKNESPVSATNYFYALSKHSNYIQSKRIQKNIDYKVMSPYGDLDITINLSKPEKDPKQIQMEKELVGKSSTYPKCLLCKENEGYGGRLGHPARSNHRLIPVKIQEENWYFQYSPYVYYNEHCILLCEEHREMKINKETFARLLDFIHLFPHYFIGSNADLPIVGGSILSHDHYQGGNFEFPMARAEEENLFTLAQYPTIQWSTVKWPMSVLRLKGKDRAELIEAAQHVLETWKEYSDEEANIRAYTGDVRHNTITPIARHRNGLYELDLVLRNNRTSDEHPLGIFHPHNDVQHIKKENIGLIEVMGLAVLPGRLAQELVEVEKYVLGEANEVQAIHLSWAEELKSSFNNETDVQTFVREAVGGKFVTVLENAGVYKRNELGQAAFKRFIHALSC